jgi:hypothetical protein
MAGERLRSGGNRGPEEGGFNLPTDADGGYLTPGQSLRLPEAFEKPPVNEVLKGDLIIEELPDRWHVYQATNGVEATLMGSRSPKSERYTVGVDYLTTIRSDNSVTDPLDPSYPNSAQVINVLLLADSRPTILDVNIDSFTGLGDHQFYDPTKPRYVSTPMKDDAFSGLTVLRAPSLETYIELRSLIKQLREGISEYDPSEVLQLGRTLERAHNLLAENQGVTGDTVHVPNGTVELKGEGKAKGLVPKLGQIAPIQLVVNADLVHAGQRLHDKTFFHPSSSIYLSIYNDGAPLSASIRPDNIYANPTAEQKAGADAIGALFTSSKIVLPGGRPHSEQTEEFFLLSGMNLVSTALAAGLAQMALEQNDASLQSLVRTRN